MKRDLGSSSLSGRKNLIFFIFWKFFRHPRGAGKEREGMMKKYIFVTGGVISGLGKGITAAALGRLLKSRGYKVASQKLDPYINIDPGTMSPYQHGEVFVTEDGAETDLDLGHYERFIDENLNRYSNLTTGKVYWNILNKERNGEYLGSTVQVIPHVTDEIKSFIYTVGRTTDADVIITEIGGTVGDIESQPFLEAIRQVAIEVGRENSMFIHVTPLLHVTSSGEYKTKPTQHSVKELRGLGIAPDVLVLRAEGDIDDEIREKIAMFCNVKPDCVICNKDVPELYYAPVMLEESRFSEIVCRELGLDPGVLDLHEWNEMLQRIESRRGSCDHRTDRKIHQAPRCLPFRGRGAASRRLRKQRARGHPLDRIGGFGGTGSGNHSGGCGRHSGAGRLRRPGRGRQNAGGSVCPGARCAVSGNLPGHADRGDGICTGCAGL